MELHGIQCAVGTLIAVRMYEKIRQMTPDREKALEHVRQFDLDAWDKKLRKFLGNGADCMIVLEEKEHKYSVTKHRERLEVILQNWEKLIGIMDEELPSSRKIEGILEQIGAPKFMEDIGLSSTILPDTFRATRDIRDKYVLSRLAWDLGVTDELTRGF